MNYNYNPTPSGKPSRYKDPSGVPTTSSQVGGVVVSDVMLDMVEVMKNNDDTDLTEDVGLGEKLPTPQQALENENRLTSQITKVIPPWIARMPKKEQRKLLNAYDVYVARSRGWSWEKIAYAADVTVQTVKRRWDTWVEFAPLAKSDDMLRQEDARLDTLLEFWTPAALTGNLEATKMVMQLQVAKTKLHGLDAKSRVAIGGLQLEQQKAAMVAQALRVALDSAKVDSDTKAVVIEGFLGNMKQLEN